MRAGFGALRNNRIDTRLLEVARFLDRGRRAGNDDAALS